MIQQIINEEREVIKLDIQHTYLIFSLGFYVNFVSILQLFCDDGKSIECTKEDIKNDLKGYASLFPILLNPWSLCYSSVTCLGI